MSEGLSPSEVGKEVSEHRTRVQETAEGEKEKGNSAADETTGRDRVMTIIEALLLTVVAVLAAWSGFAAAKWGTESSLDLVENREAALWNQMRDRHPGGRPAARCWI